MLDGSELMQSLEHDDGSGFAVIAVVMPEGRKSMALSVTLQPVERTLTDDDIQAISDAIVAQVAKATGGELRG